VAEVIAGLILPTAIEERQITILCLALDGERAVIIGEVEPVWSSLTAVLPKYLPGIEPIEVWVGQLDGEGPVTLYERGDQQTLLQ